MPDRHERPLPLPVRILLGFLRAIEVAFTALAGASGDPKVNATLVPPDVPTARPKEYRP